MNQRQVARAIRVTIMWYKFSATYIRVRLMVYKNRNWTIGLYRDVFCLAYSKGYSVNVKAKKPVNTYNLAKLMLKDIHAAKTLHRHR